MDLPTERASPFLCWVTLTSSFTGREETTTRFYTFASTVRVTAVNHWSCSPISLCLLSSVMPRGARFQSLISLNPQRRWGIGLLAGDPIEFPITPLDMVLQVYLSFFWSLVVIINLGKCHASWFWIIRSSCCLLFSAVHNGY